MKIIEKIIKILVKQYNSFDFTSFFCYDYKGDNMAKYDENSIKILEGR